VELEDGAVCEDDNLCTAGDVCQDGACSSDASLNCYDGNPCTDDGCTPKGGCVFSPNQAPCDDESKCTLSDTCLGGQCKGDQLNCADGEACTEDQCDPATGCTYTNISVACEDGNPCTIADGCEDGACISGPKKPCNDNDECTDEHCDLKDGNCVFAYNSDPCSDNSTCTAGDVCEFGECNGTVVDCEDGNLCTEQDCEALTGCVYSFVVLPCDDDDLCTSGDLCMDGDCLGGESIVCNDGDPCTVEACIAGIGCLPSPDSGDTCSDGNACTSEDTCLEGICNPGTATICFDGNPCTGDACAPTTGCVFETIPGSCNDDNICTLNDACDNGNCVGEWVLCDDGNPCTQDACDTLSAGCTFTPLIQPCTDGNPCTVGDLCDALGDCIAGDPKTCEDGNPCTSDLCNGESGECEQTPNLNPCDDNNACTIADACAEGTCSGSSATCDDGNPCTDTICDPNIGCLHPPLSDIDCDDDEVCTTSDQCAGGECWGEPVNCDDGEVCTDDSCLDGTGCVHVGNAAPCEDGDPCTSDDQCTAGTCLPGNSLCECKVDADCDPLNDANLCNGTLHCDHDSFPWSCEVDPATVIICADDPEDCIVPSCEPATGDCPTTILLPGSDCSDKNACTTDDACVGATCFGGPAPNCFDGNVCTDDSCEPAIGCINLPNDAICDDSDSCTLDDICEGGFCAGLPCELQGLSCIEGQCIEICYGTKPTCAMPSCAAILSEVVEPPSGLYWVDLDVDGPKPPFQVMCDMVKGGGGWTGFSAAQVEQWLNAQMSVAEWATNDYGVDDEGRPYTQDGAGNHTHYWNFSLPFIYSEFFLADYSARANAAPEEMSEIIPGLFHQTVWATANNGALGWAGQSGYGDIAFGCPLDPGPATSFAIELPDSVECESCEVPWPADQQVYAVTSPETTSFRISWGEAGKQAEGWYPWWQGLIYFR
jgi:hypothetical protein